MRKLAIHFALGIGLGLLVFMASFLLMLIPGMGYGILTVLYALIIFAQGAFYVITAVHGRTWSTISFVVNFIVWVTELVQLEHLLEGTSTHQLLYHNDSYYWLRFVLGGVLWAANKLLLDAIIDAMNFKSKVHAGADHQ